MTEAAALTVEERLRQLLGHLGIAQAHFVTRVPDDSPGLARRCPEMVSSLTAIGGVDPQAVEPLAARLLVITGDRGRNAEAVRAAMPRLRDAQLVTLRDYEIFAWTDLAAERTEELGAEMMQFLARISPPAAQPSAPVPAGEGEFAGVSYRIRGAGPPLVLLPMFLAASQWEPLIPLLSDRYCTITLGGAAVGAVALLESRGRAVGYLQMVRTLLEEAHVQPGDKVLEVGSGTGVLLRWLARRTAGGNQITGVDINPYLLREATALARREGLADLIAFREGNAESLPFPDASFDVVMSVTVIEEVDADRMLAEVVRITKPGGRVALAARAIDLPYLANLPLSPALKTKVEAPRGGVAPRGCADASLYRRMRQSGLAQVKMLPQLTAFDRSDATFLEHMQGQLLANPTPEEAREWLAARAEAEAEGAFFMAWPHHSAVGTKAL